MQDSFSSIRSKSKLQPASKQDAAVAACRLLKAPGGFDDFSAKLQHLYRLHGVEWPQVTVRYNNLSVKTEVGARKLNIDMGHSNSKPVD